MTDKAVPKTGSRELALANGRRLLAHDAEAAAEQAREILSRNEHDGDALRLLAQALRRVNRKSEAERVEVKAVEAAAHNPVLASVGRAIVENRLSDAGSTLQPYLQEHPNDAAAVRLLAELVGRAGEVARAEELLRRSIELAPAYADTYVRLATVLCFQNRVQESLLVLDELLAIDPTAVLALDAKAATLARVGEYGDAAGIYEEMLRLAPTHVSGWIGYGQILNTIGKTDASIAAYRRVIELDPTRGEAWWSLANLKISQFTAHDIEVMSAVLPGLGPTGDQAVYLHFALGKALEDAGRYGEAFEHFNEGNKIRAAGTTYDPKLVHDLVRRSEKVFTRKFFEERQGSGVPEKDPIFIVGLPRAGSTLVEQILASHSLIEGTIELQYMGLIRRKLMQGPRGFPEGVNRLSGTDLAAYGKEYLDSSSLHRKTDEPYFTDKLPNNWESLGLILTILPNAKIIDARRHPMSCCFSNFKQLFSHGQDFSYSLDWIGRYYVDYVRMMRHFDELFPGRIHRVIHEQLIDNPEAEIRRLLGYVGVPFEESCLRFYENERPVRTPSAGQVRQPLNRKGMEQWLNFEPWLGELKQSLGPVLLAYPRVPDRSEL
jgi:tetratricopeptide (TPR) repeat protein